MGIRHIRHGSILAVIWIAYVPAWISHTDLGKQIVDWIDLQQRFVVRGCQIAALISAAFFAFHGFSMPILSTEVASAGEVCYPTGAVQYLQQQEFEGNMLVPFHAGAYVSWELHPRPGKFGWTI